MDPTKELNQIYWKWNEHHTFKEDLIDKQKYIYSRGQKKKVLLYCWKLLENKQGRL